MLNTTLNIPEGYEIQTITSNDKEIIILFTEKEKRVIVKGFQ